MVAKRTNATKDPMIPVQALFLVVPALLIFSIFSSGVSVHKAIIPNMTPTIANSSDNMQQTPPKIIIAASTAAIKEKNHTATVQKLT